MSSNKIKFLAYYLPQFHPIPENDTWWGKGFTEWTNVKKAKPLFKNHNQPIIPGELGYYDLLKQSEIQEQQAILAKAHGIDGFIYYQYWFGDKLLLEKPAEAMLKNKKVDLPFCFCWANETWKGIWHGLDNPEVLIEQTYQGEQGYKDYFNYLLPFFEDDRYIKVDNKPMFHIYRIEDIQDIEIFAKTFNDMAKQAGFEGVYLISTVKSSNDFLCDHKFINAQVGIDVFFKIRYSKPQFFSEKSLLCKIKNKLIKKFGQSYKIGVRTKPLIFDYAKGVSQINVKFPNKKYIACVFPNWDNSPRSGKKSLIFKNATPQAWQKHLQIAVDELKSNPENPQYIVIKSWNEWAEGNHLEPDQKFGLQWLKAIKNVKNNM